MNKLTKTQIVSLALLLGALATQICTLDHWSDALRPGFVGGIFGIISANLLSLFSDNPVPKDKV